MGRKSKVERVVGMITSAAKFEKRAAEAEPPTAESQWWTKLTLRQFKDTLLNLDRAEIATLVATMQEANRAVTLRQNVEDLTLEGQKAAARMAPIHRGCIEAALARMHSIPNENKPLAG